VQGDRASDGDDNVVIGNRTVRGSRNVIIDSPTVLNKGGLAIGHGAYADSTSIAIGAGAGAGQALPALLAELAARLAEAGDRQAADEATALAAQLRSDTPDPNAIRRLWAGVKVAATTHEFLGLVASVEPLLRHL
jgi:hypothetical protein